MEIRDARPEDAEAIARIQSEAIAERVATFKTDPRTAAEVLGWLGDGRPLIVCAVGSVVEGWARVGPYEDGAPYYAGVGEAGVYVSSAARGRGLGRLLLATLEERAAAAGFHKLVAKVFTSNLPSLALFGAAGWRQVGVHERHGALDGEWRDVAMLEKPLVA